MGKEQEMVIHVTRFLKEDGYNVRMEVPSLGQSADLVATKGRWVTFIEVKTHDWRRALEQCKAHKHVADFICIALGTKQISKQAEAAVEEAGFGLLHCSEGERVSWVLGPRRNRTPWLPQRQKLSKVLRSIEYAS